MRTPSKLQVNDIALPTTITGQHHRRLFRCINAVHGHRRHSFGAGLRVGVVGVAWLFAARGQRFIRQKEGEKLPPD